MPVAAEDLTQIYDATDWQNPDSVTLRCAISIAWFPMLRMGEYLEKNTRTEVGEVNLRHPLLMDEIEPMVNGTTAERSGKVGEISIYISGPARDWLNQGMVRSRNIIQENENNSHLRPVLGLQRLRHLCPAKFHRGKERLFASWMSGKTIRPDRLVSLLRMAVFQHGMNPSAYSLHSLRALGRLPNTGPLGT